MVSFLRDALQIKNSTWQWQQWNGLPYLTCTLLQDWKHGFLTQQFSPRLPEDLTEVLHPNAATYRVEQVHGCSVLTPAEIEIQMTTGTLKAPFPPADGLITDDKNQAIWVASADCTPVLIGDIETRRVAAIHAGWRGTAQSIVPKAIAYFQDFGSTLENIRVAIGPAISGEVYQVSEQVAAEVGASLFEKEKISSTQEVLEALQTMFCSPLLPDPKPGRVRLDVRRVNELQLHKLGIGKDQIMIAPHCTYQEPDDFFSYRRTKQKKVQWSGIVCGTP